SWNHSAASMIAPGIPRHIVAAASGGRPHCADSASRTRDGYPYLRATAAISSLEIPIMCVHPLALRALQFVSMSNPRLHISHESLSGSDPRSTKRLRHFVVALDIAHGGCAQALSCAGAVNPQGSRAALQCA